MKICKLKLKNLNSFRDPIDLDFENPPLDDASIVAITGPTGAGKTTLLDAICVALYGKTPRLSGTGSQHPRHLISHGEKEGFAEVHFMANATRYVAVWSLRRGSAAEVRLSYAENNKLISDKLSGKGKALGSSQRTVSEEVETILGLDFDAFRRSIMLAQGEFAAFLKASKEDRRTILEATAGIHIYDLLRQTLIEKVKEVEAVNADVLDKLNKIPEASHEQLSEAEAVFDRLQAETDTLNAHSQQIQTEKYAEVERKEGYEKLQSSEGRWDELTNQQPEIDALQAELENAQRAERLRSEKQTSDTAKSDLENAEKALDTATTEKNEAEEQVKTDQADFDEKEKAYQTTSTEHKEKVDVYTNAKLDVRRAADQFAEADKRTVGLGDLDDEIDTLSDQLTNSETEQTQLQKRIKEAQTFLEKNPLPADRQHRLNRANVLSTQLDSQQKQLEASLTSQATHSESVSALKQEINKLSETREERLSEKTHAKTGLETATAELNKLLASGTREEWDARKQQAARAQPIAQKYETTKDDLMESEDHLCELNETEVELDAKLAQIGAELTSQTEVCQRATAAVQSCEESLKSTLLADSANQLRQHLHEGEPCPVCGATEHPGHGVVMESEGEERLQNAESALEHAKTEAQAAEAQRQALKTRQAQTERDKRNIMSQIDDLTDEVGTLRNKASRLLAEWQVIYPDADVSSKWTSEQFDIADTAIADITEAEQTQMKASNAFQIVAQQLETCENNIKRETEDLNTIETQLEGISNTITDLQADVAATKTRFWESMPDSFHGVAPAAAVKQFDDKIEEVGKREGERDSAKTQLQVLNVNIEADQANLKGLEEHRETLNAEIDGYRREGETYLSAVRDKTGGLETEDKINTAMDTLEAELQAKVEARDDAEQQFQNSQNLLIQKQATHRHCEEQYEESSEKLKTACDIYFQKLNDAGFDSPEAHDNAFRDEEQMQELTDQINTHEDEKQALELVITELRARFQENPFNPETLAAIETQVKEIESQFQAKLEERGAQQQKIDDLKDALERREALGTEISEAEQELKRWKTLQNTIPRNDLRDFALEIMFKQMGELANEQLKYLTSERYQLKVEGIGDLTVVDKWNANEERPVETLSGGESFLTSLALALALADLSRGRAQLNSLFLDEGFGTLDAETLDVAIAALEGLRMQGRSIFLISHIQELTRRLPVKINVRKQGNGSSSVDIRG